MAVGRAWLLPVILRISWSALSTELSTPSLGMKGCNYLATLITPIDRIQPSNFIYLGYRVRRVIYKNHEDFLM